MTINRTFSNEVSSMIDSFDAYRRRQRRLYHRIPTPESQSMQLFRYVFSDDNVAPIKCDGRVANAELLC